MSGESNQAEGRLDNDNDNILIEDKAFNYLRHIQPTSFLVEELLVFYVNKVELLTSQEIGLLSLPFICSMFYYI